jgi:hypothetical protein
MKNSEAIRKYYDTIRDALLDCYRTVLECNGRIQYKVYVWEDGEIERLEAPQGDTGWLQAREYEPRKLFYVDLIDAPFFDPWDYSDVGKPDDDAEAEALRQEIIDYLVESFEADVDDRLDHIIQNAEEAEKYMEEDNHESY